MGSNISTGKSSPLTVAHSAVEKLSDYGFVPSLVSRCYRSPAWPPNSGPDYVNAALRLPAKGDPRAFLEVLHAVEREFGRVRSGRWGPRTLDLDLLAWGDRVLPDPRVQERWRGLPPERQREEAPDELILPHPRMQDRAFVLVPLVEVAPDWVHPLLRVSVREMLDALPATEKAAIVPV